MSDAAAPQGIHHKPVAAVASHLVHALPSGNNLAVVAVSASCLQPKDWSISMNKKERRLALATALQSAAGDVVVVDDIKQAAGGQQLGSKGPCRERRGAIHQLPNTAPHSRQQRCQLSTGRECCDLMQHSGAPGFSGAPPS